MTSRTTSISTEQIASLRILRSTLSVKSATILTSPNNVLLLTGMAGMGSMTRGGPATTTAGRVGFDGLQHIYYLKKMETYVVKMLGVLAQRGRDVLIACGVPSTHPLFEDMASLERGEMGPWYTTIYAMLKERAESVFVSAIVHRRSRTRNVRTVEDVGIIDGYTSHAYYLCGGVPGE